MRQIQNLLPAVFGAELSKSVWDKLLERCESPIERELVDLFRGNWLNAEPAFGPRRMDAGGARLVYCQYPIQKFRADFLIVQNGSTPLVVECDGHAYHQGDPTTWVRDAARDKAMRDAGYETLHFTGSRIYSYPDEVLSIIERALRGEFRAAA